ncbi:MAG: ComF family protein [Patescibacteria group bacterium]|nr:ComF family protein [Patescibacteria group bacterium]
MSLYSVVSRLFRSVLFVFFPNSCVFCGSFQKDSVCQKCDDVLVVANSPYFCPLCKKTEVLSVGYICDICQKKDPGFSKLYSVYSGLEKEVITYVSSIKYSYVTGNMDRCVDDFSLFVSQLPQQERDQLFQEFAWVSVPLYWFRYLQRGFNQSQLFVDILSDVYPSLRKEALLLRKRHTRRQAVLDKETRKTNLDNAFVLNPSVSCVPEKVLLVDDVYTTGSTIRECVSVLKKAGVKEIRVLVLFRK